MLFLYSIVAIIFCSGFIALLSSPLERVYVSIPVIITMIGLVSIFFNRLLTVPSIPFLFAGSITSSVMFTYMLLRKSKHSIRLACTLGILAALFATFNIANNYWFFWDKAHSGFVNGKFLPNLPCSSSAPIYVAKKNGQWHYRCPSDKGDGIFIVLGKWWDYPLIPWPDYNSGTSESIGRVLHSHLQN